MIVSRPSISTTGPGLGVEQAEVGQQVALPWRPRAARRGRGCAPSRRRRPGARVGLAHAVGKCRLAARWQEPCDTRGRGEARTSKQFIEVPYRLRARRPAVGPAAALRAPAVPRPRTRTRGSTTPRPSSSWPSATARSSAGSPPTSTTAGTSSRAATTGCSASSSSSDDPEVAGGADRRRVRAGSASAGASGCSARWTSR